jgi:Flagellar basal body-associated protein
MIKKMLPWLVIVLVAVTLITVAAFVLWEALMKDPLPDDPALLARNSVDNVRPDQLSAEQISKLTVNMDDITTNLSDLDYVVRISFAFQLSNDKAKDEFTKLEHLAKSTVIKTLSDTKPEEIRGSEGQDALISKLMNSINGILREGKVSKIDITQLIISRL